MANDDQGLTPAMKKAIEAYLDKQLKTRLASFTRDAARKEVAESLANIFRKDAIGSLLGMGDDDDEEVAGEPSFRRCGASVACCSSSCCCCTAVQQRLVSWRWVPQPQPLLLKQLMLVAVAVEKTASEEGSGKKRKRGEPKEKRKMSNYNLFTRWGRIDAGTAAACISCWHAV
jgi:hypothetical protein